MDHLKHLLGAYEVNDGDIAEEFWASGVFTKFIPVIDLVVLIRKVIPAFSETRVRALAAAMTLHDHYPQTIATAPVVRKTSEGILDSLTPAHALARLDHPAKKSSRQRRRQAKQEGKKQLLEADRERLATEEAERERLATQEAGRERLATEEAERERLATEEAERELLAAEEAERERLATEEAGRERLATEEAERERLAAEEAGRERLATEEAECEPPVTDREHLQSLLYENGVFDEDVASALWGSGVFQRYLPMEELLAILRSHTEYFSDKSARAVAVKMIGHAHYPKAVAKGDGIVGAATASAVEHQDRESELALVETPVFAVLADFLCSLFDDLAVDVQLTKTCTGLLVALGRAWDESWLALQRSFSQADLRPEHTEACVARIRRLQEFLAHAEVELHGTLPAFSPSAKDQASVAVSELGRKVDQVRLSEINPATLRRFATQLAQVEAALTGLIICDGLQSERLALNVWRYLEECSKALTIDETCQSHEVAARLSRLRSFDLECGVLLLDRLGKRSEGLVTTSVQRLVDGLSKLSSKCSDQLLRVVSELSSQGLVVEGGQDVRSVKTLAVLHELTSSKQLQDALQMDDLTTTYYDGVVKQFRVLSTELDCVEVSDVQQLLGRVALYETLACTGDVKLRQEMQQKKERLFGDIRTNALTIQEEFVGIIAEMHRQFKMDAKAALRDSDAMSAGEDSLLLEALPHTRLARLLVDAAVRSTAGAALRIPVASSALNKMVDALQGKVKEVLVIIERKIREGHPMNKALPVAIAYANHLLDVVPGEGNDASVGEHGATVLLKARGEANKMAEHLVTCCTVFVNGIPRELMNKAQSVPLRGWVSTYVKGSEAAKVLVLCDVEPAKQLGRDLEASARECVNCIRARVTTAQDTKDFKGLALIIAEELSPMLHGGNELKNTALSLMKGCEKCINALCDEAEEAQWAHVDPDQFHDLMQELKAMQAIFSEGDNLGLPVCDTITNVLKAMRCRALSVQQDFMALVKVSPAPDTVGIDSTGIVNAVQLLAAMDEGPRATCGRHLNNVVRAALEGAKADTLRGTDALRVMMHLRSVFENSSVMVHLDEEIISMWAAHDAIVSDKVASSRRLFLAALDCGYTDDIARMKHQLDVAQNASGVNEDISGGILSDYLDNLQNAYAAAAEDRRDCNAKVRAMQKLLEGIGALPSGVLTLRQSGTVSSAMIAFQKFLLQSKTSISKKTEQGKYRNAQEEVNATSEVIRSVRVYPCLENTLGGRCTDFEQFVRGLQIVSLEKAAIAQICPEATPSPQSVLQVIAGLLQQLPEVSDASRASVYDILSRCVSEACSRVPAVIADDCQAVTATVEVARLADTFASLEHLEVAETQATLRRLREDLRRHTNHRETALSIIMQRTLIVLHAGRISVELANALATARAVEEHLPSNAATDFDSAKEAFWTCFTKVANDHIAAIKKGDLANVSFTFLTNTIDGYNSLSNANRTDLMQSIPANLTQSIRFTCAANVEDEIRAAAADFFGKCLAEMADTPRELVQYYGTVKALSAELSKFLPAPLPESDVNGTTMCEVLRVLSLQCKDAWHKVVRSRYQADCLKEFQQPTSKLLAFSDSLKHVAADDIVARKCGKCVQDTFLSLDKELSSVSYECLRARDADTSAQTIPDLLIRIRTWARQAPCIEPRVSATIKSTLTKLAAASPRLACKIWTVLKQRGDVGKQIVDEMGDVFNFVLTLRAMFVWCSDTWNNGLSEKTARCVDAVVAFLPDLASIVIVALLAHVCKSLLDEMTACDVALTDESLCRSTKTCKSLVGAMGLVWQVLCISLCFFSASCVDVLGGGGCRGWGYCRIVHRQQIRDDIDIHEGIQKCAVQQKALLMNKAESLAAEAEIAVRERDQLKSRIDAVRRHLLAAEKHSYDNTKDVEEAQAKLDQLTEAETEQYLDFSKQKEELKSKRATLDKATKDVLQTMEERTNGSSGQNNRLVNGEVSAEETKRDEEQAARWQMKLRAANQEVATASAELAAAELQVKSAAAKKIHLTAERQALEAHIAMLKGTTVAARASLVELEGKHVQQQSKASKLKKDAATVEGEAALANSTARSEANTLVALRASAAEVADDIRTARRRWTSGMKSRDNSPTFLSSQ